MQKTSPRPHRRTRLKVILVGDSGVGKTFLYKRFITDEVPSTCVPTLGMDFFTKEFDLDSNLHFNLDVWDTAGQEKFRAVNRSYYSEADLIFFVYDITEKKSFQNLEYWIEDFETYGTKSNPVVLLGMAISFVFKCVLFITCNFIGVG